MLKYILYVLVLSQDLLLSGSDDAESDLSDTEQVHILLELQHKRKKVWRKRVKRNPRVRHPISLSQLLMCIIWFWFWFWDWSVTTKLLVYTRYASSSLVAKCSPVVSS